jgi:hypothetical protein
MQELLTMNDDSQSFFKNKATIGPSVDFGDPSRTPSLAFPLPSDLHSTSLQTLPSFSSLLEVRQSSLTRNFIPQNLFLLLQILISINKLVAKPQLFTVFTSSTVFNGLSNVFMKQFGSRKFFPSRIPHKMHSCSYI